MEHMNGGKWMSIAHAIVAMVEDVKMTCWEYPFKDKWSYERIFGGWWINEYRNSH